MKHIPFGRPMLGAAEQRAVCEVLEGPVLTHGDRVREFEQAFGEFTGAAHALATASCTAAMQLAHMAAGIGPGDEVIVPAQTHVASAHAVELCGARCVFVDSEPRSGNMDLDQVEAAVSPRTRALVVVHYLGKVVDMSRVADLAGRHDLFVVEDCALALGARRGGCHVGLLGDAGCFSFYPIKHITTAEGGMLITRHPRIARGGALRRAFGIDRDDPADRDLPGMYNVSELGLNCRLNELSAAVGLQQLRRLPAALECRRRNLRLLCAGLRELEVGDVLGEDDGDGGPGDYCLVLRLQRAWGDRRAAIMSALAARGVGTSIYYPRPVPLMSYYRRKYGCADGGFPVATAISERSIALPIGPHVTEADVAYIVAQLKAIVCKAGAP